jgi:hypothetical protein
MRHCSGTAQEMVLFFPDEAGLVADYRAMVPRSAAKLMKVFLDSCAASAVRLRCCYHCTKEEW